MQYSIDSGRKVVDVCKKQNSLRKTASLLEVSCTFVQNRAGRWKAGESLGAKPPGSGNLKKIQEVRADFLLNSVENENDPALEEIRQRLEEKFAAGLCIPTLHSSLAGSETGRKKNFRRSSGSKRRKCFEKSRLSFRFARSR